MTDTAELTRIRELLEMMLATQLQGNGVPQSAIAQVLGKGNNWTNELLKRTKPAKKLA